MWPYFLGKLGGLIREGLLYIELALNWLNISCNAPVQPQQQLFILLSVKQLMVLMFPVHSFPISHYLLDFFHHILTEHHGDGPPSLQSHGNPGGHAVATEPLPFVSFQADRQGVEAQITGQGNQDLTMGKDMYVNPINRWYEASISLRLVT